MVATGGIGPPIRGFSAAIGAFEGFSDQSLAALANPHSSHTTAQLRHTQLEVVTTNTAAEF
jgi:hypothetical protein